MRLINSTLDPQTRSFRLGGNMILRSWLRRLFSGSGRST